MNEADNYQALFQELGGDPEAIKPVEDQVTPEPTDDTVPTEPVSPEEPEVTVPVPETPAEDTPVVPPVADDDAAQNELRNKAFAQMRTQNSKYAKVFTQLQKSLGANSEEEVIEKLINAGVETEAKRNNVDPEMLKRLNQIEQKNLEYANRERNQSIVESFGQVQKEFSLTQSEVLAFAQTLQDKRIDILGAGVDISTIYRGMHFEEINAKKIEEAKQAWIKGDTDADSASGIQKIAGKKSDPTKTKIETMGDLNNLLNTMNK